MELTDRELMLIRLALKVMISREQGFGAGKDEDLIHDLEHLYTKIKEGVLNG